MVFVGKQALGHVMKWPANMHLGVESNALNASRVFCRVTALASNGQIPDVITLICMYLCYITKDSKK